MGGTLRYAGLNSFSMPEKHEKITPVLQAITETSITGLGDPLPDLRKFNLGRSI